MKTLNLFSAVAIVSVLAVAGCETGEEGSFSEVSSTSGLISEQACGETVWNLTAGQTIDVGSVTVQNDADYLYVTYSLDYPGATFGNLHLWVGNSLLNLPSNPQGIPVPGQFCNADGGACADASGLTSYTFEIPFDDLNIVDISEVCGLNLYVVTHAEVNADTDGDGTIDHETAFGGPNPGDGPRWWFYGEYSICCDTGDSDPDPLVCETAFAKGDWVWTTSRKSNPENLDSLELTRNRWGWAINLMETGSSQYDIWAGAGLNDVSKGELVGSLDVNWDGSTVFVTYTVLADFSIEEIHLYAGDAEPYTIAPGQYGYVQDFDPNVAEYSFAVPLADLDGVQGVWLVAHAVVCH